MVDASIYFMIDGNDFVQCRMEIPERKGGGPPDLIYSIVCLLVSANVIRHFIGPNKLSK
jgi:hypothetical protein